MDELVRWLGEQLNEDQRAAEEALKRTTTTRRWIGGEWVEDVVQPPEWRRSAWHPARVLREINAKRRILEIHQVVGGWEDEDGQDIGLGCDECGYSAEYSDRGGWCETLRLLALPYADRPGYQESWRP